MEYCFVIMHFCGSMLPAWSYNVTILSSFGFHCSIFSFSLVFCRMDPAHLERIANISSMMCNSAVSCVPLNAGLIDWTIWPIPVAAVAHSKWHYHYDISWWKDMYIFHLQDKFTLAHSRAHTDKKPPPLSFGNPRVRQKHNGTASDLHKLNFHLNIDEPMNLFTNNQMHAHSLTSTHYTQ